MLGLVQVTVGSRAEDGRDQGFLSGCENTAEMTEQNKVTIHSHQQEHGSCAISRSGKSHGTASHFLQIKITLM